MALDAKKVAELVKDGVVFACAACKHFHEGVEKGLAGCGKQDCDTPTAFAKYSGPITEWKTVCWVCGQPAKVGLHFISTGRTLGACEDHQNVHEGDSGVQTVLLIP